MTDDSVTQLELSPTAQQREFAWQQYDGCHGESDEVQALLAFVQSAAQSTETLLLMGESGMRLEQCARAIHQTSHHRTQPFLSINAHKLGDEDLHGLLFGHGDKQGMLASLSGGTIYLNGLTGLSPVLQQRLAVYLEERNWRRELASAQRLILGTDLQAVERNVSNRIAYGLVEMLRPHGFVLKPLRERRTDIPAIARQMLRRMRHQLVIGAVELPPATEEALLGYDWPHNLDELEGVLFAALTQLGVQKLSENNLPAHVRFAQLRSLPPEGVAMPQLMDEYERGLLATALRQTGASQTKAAKLLGLRVQTLNMKLKRMAEEGRSLL